MTETEKRIIEILLRGFKQIITSLEKVLNLKRKSDA